MRKGLITKFTLILLALTVSVSPFLIPSVISANEIVNDFGIVGVNVSLIDRETSYKINSISVPLQELSLESEFCEFRQIKYSENANYSFISPVCELIDETIGYTDLTFNMEIPQHNLTVNSSTTQIYLYEYEIVFDRHYVGSLRVNTLDLSVNGTSVSFTSLSNITTFTFSNIDLKPYLENIYWNIPIESYMVNYPHYINGTEQVLLGEFNGYSYPLWSFHTNEIIANPFMYDRDDITYDLVIFASANITANNIGNYLQFDNMTMVRYRDFGLASNINNTNGRLFKATFKLNSGLPNGSYPIKAKRDFNAFLILGLRTADYFYFNMNTEMALNYEYSNKYLDSIYRIDETIYNGTTSSNNSVDNANATNDNLGNTENDYQQLNNNFNNDLSNNLNNIDLSLRLNSNNNFIQATTWIKNRINWFTNNFGGLNLLIIYSLILGLTMLLIGKVFK